MSSFFGKPGPSDPSKPVTTLKTAWNNVRKKAKITGRWHDHRHTMITDLAESGAGDHTIMDIAGHLSKSMLKHYSHIRMEARRTGVSGQTCLAEEISATVHPEIIDRLALSDDRIAGAE